MTFKTDLRNALEHEETRTVSDTFGGVKLPGKAPSYSVGSIADWISANRPPMGDPLRNALDTCKSQLGAEFGHFLNCAVRFSFLIELTNLTITSTKMKTRWVPGHITKTKPGTFTNYRGDFAPGRDQRSASYDECFEIFTKVVELVCTSPKHLDAVVSLARSKNRRISYEFVVTYVDASLNPVHTAQNIRLCTLGDLDWLIKARSLINKELNTALCNKIKTKAYLTDRAQTGTDQTNRAKRWEILSSDFQHASLEQCWSVERTLLSDLAHFDNFPAAARASLVTKGLFTPGKGVARCPILLVPLDFKKIILGSKHGRSDFQVGHRKPLKIGGKHDGSNISWITGDGNRIQGDLEVAKVRQLIRDISQRMNQLNIT